MSDDLHLICDEHGVFLRRDAIELGYTDQSLARLVRQRTVHRIRHGSYSMGQEWDGLKATERHWRRAMAVLRTSRASVAVSHTTALIGMDVPVWDLALDLVHVTRLDHRGGRKAAGVAQHRGRLCPDELTSTRGVQATSAARTAIDLTTMADVEHCLPVLDHLLHVEATTKEELRVIAKRQEFWAHTLTTDLVIQLADGRRESVGESRSAYMFWRGGLPRPQPNHKILDERGRVFARVDFAWPGLGVFLEFDGKEKYLRYRREGESVIDAVLREKRREERICRLTGWRCIRITWADLYRPEATVAYIASVLAGGPVHP